MFLKKLYANKILMERLDFQYLNLENTSNPDDFWCYKNKKKISHGQKNFVEWTKICTFAENLRTYKKHLIK